MKQLNPREKKYVAQRVQGKSRREAHQLAGFQPNASVATRNKEAQLLEKRPHIQQAIDAALISQGATPEWAVAQIKKVAEQDKELASKRLAAKDILELHGWNKADRPTLQLDIKNAFFGNARQNEETRIIEAE